MRTMARHASGTAAASAPSATVGIARSSTASFAAPLTSTGLRAMQPSWTAPRMMLAIRRYAFSAVPGSFAASALCQATT